MIYFHNDNATQYIELGLTTVGQPTTDMGKIAVQLLLDMIDKDASEWKSVYKILKHELIIRGSS